MRVAINIEQLLHRPPGGIGTYTAELVRRLPRMPRGGEPVELAPFVARHRRAAIETALGAFDLSETPVVRLLLPRPVLYDTWNLLGVPTLGLLHRSLRDIDLVHAPSLAVPPRSGVPLIVTVHDAAALRFPETFPRRGRRFHARGSTAAAERADVVIAPTLAAGHEIVEHTSISPDRIRVVPHGVGQRIVADGVVSSTRTTLDIGDEPYVLWVGTFEPRKNLPVLVDAFRRVVAAADLPHRLVLVGPDGWLDTTEAIRGPIAELGDRVQVTGPIRTDLLVALYRGADLFAFPSLHEGFGLPVLEAMSQATAVICSDIPVLREVAGEVASFVPPDDAAAWGDALVALLRDETARATLGAEGRRRAEQFTWEQCAERTRAVYTEVLGATGTPTNVPVDRTTHPAD